MSTGIITVICMFLCAAFGNGIGYILFRKKPKDPIGTLRIDTSDPDGPYLFLELHTPVSEVMKQKQVTLDVNTQSYISQN